MNKKTGLSGWFCSIMRMILHKRSFALGDTEQSIYAVEDRILEEDRDGLEIYTDPKSCFYELHKHSTCYAHGYVVSPEHKKKTTELTCEFIKSTCPNTRVSAIFYG